MSHAETKITITAEDHASSELRHIQELMNALGQQSDEVAQALSRLGTESVNLCAAMSEMGQRLPVERLQETVVLLERLSGAQAASGEAVSVVGPGPAAGATTSSSGNVFHININALDARDVSQFFRERLDPYLQRRSRDGYDVIYSDGLRQIS